MNKKILHNREEKDKKVNKSVSKSSIIDRFAKKSKNHNKNNSNSNNNNNNNSNNNNNNNNDNINFKLNRKNKREFLNSKKESVLLENLNKKDKEEYWRKQTIKILNENRQLEGKDYQSNIEQLNSIKNNNKNKKLLNESNLIELSDGIDMTVRSVKCYRDRSIILKRMDELKYDKHLTGYGKIEFKIFGSSSCSLALNKSDIDMVMMVEKQLQPKEQRQWIYKMAQVLRYYGMERVQPIPFAKVPIIKFYDPRTQFDCDLTLTKDSGNTMVVKEFCRYSPSLLPTLIIFLKYWAAKRNINDASLGTLSSYSITNMIIHILQLKNKLVSYSQLKLNLINNNSSDEDNDQDNNNSNSIKNNKKELAEILIFFFQYYGYLFNYRYSMINIGQNLNDPVNTTKPLEKSSDRVSSDNLNIGGLNSCNSSSSSEDYSDSEEEDSFNKILNNQSKTKLSYNDTKDLLYIKDCIEGHNITRCVQRDKLFNIIKEFKNAYASLLNGKLPI